MCGPCKLILPKLVVLAAEIANKRAQVHFLCIVRVM
jgi:hypothetical protein